MNYTWVWGRHTSVHVLCVLPLVSSKSLSEDKRALKGAALTSAEVPQLSCLCLTASPSGMGMARPFWPPDTSKDSTCHAMRCTLQLVQHFNDQFSSLSAPNPLIHLWIKPLLFVGSLLVFWNYSNYQTDKNSCLVGACMLVGKWEDKQ
jgi:hypothetical protein